MAVDRNSRIVVAGAGSIGCYVGGCLAPAGRNVTLLLRPALADAIGRHGLRISDLDGADRTLPAAALTFTTGPIAALAGAEIVLVTVKSGATADMAKLIARHAPASHAGDRIEDVHQRGPGADAREESETFVFFAAHGQALSRR